jgi:hypothetical protein
LKKISLLLEFANFVVCLTDPDEYFFGVSRELIEQVENIMLRFAEIQRFLEIRLDFLKKAI